MKEQEMVREFHVKNGYKVDCLLTKERTRDAYVDAMTDLLLKSLSQQLLALQKVYQNKAVQLQELGDARLYRSIAMIEELGEVLEALANRDEVELADGLGDLEYFVNGTAVTYNIPMKEVFAEIQKANMAKKQRDPKNDPRMRDKGEGWQRPDIKGAIERGRDKECNVHWVCVSYDKEICKQRCELKNNGKGKLKYCLKDGKEVKWKHKAICNVCNKNLVYHGACGCLRAYVEGGPPNGCGDFERSKHANH